MSFIERLRTVPAILKILCLIFEIVGFILSKLSFLPTWGTADAFCIIAGIIFILTAILLIFYMLKADNVCGLNLDKIELYFAAGSAVIFLVISSLVLILAASIVVAIFGYLTMATYAIDAYLRYRERA